MAARRELSDLFDQTIGQTLSRVSEQDAPTAGGSSCAIAGALAAALTAMVARSAHDRWREAGGAVAQAEALRLRLCASVSRDAEVYGKARMLLRESGRDREHRGVGGATAARAREQRDFELAQALTSAAAEPVAIAEAAADVAALAAWSAENAGADERADALVAASLAEAAAGGAAQLVLVNLSVRTDDDLAARAKAAAAAAAESRSRAQATL